jgi:hypothetical protein
MGLVLTLLSYVGIICGFLFLTLAIASGLYYLSELVEEHTVVTKRMLTRAILSIIGLHILLLVIDRFPFWLSVFSIGSQILYLQNLKRFPYISLSSGTFIATPISVILNHYLWFRYFTDPSIPPHGILAERPYYKGPTHPPFSQVASFFGICIWLVPFALFISLSASENVLPLSVDSSEGRDSSSAKQKGTALAKLVIDKLWYYVAKVANQFGYDLDTGHDRII